MSQSSRDVRFEQVWKLFGNEAPAVSNLNLHIHAEGLGLLAGPRRLNR